MPILNYRKVFLNIPSITTLPFQFHSNVWKGGFYIDGTKHATRTDKTVVYMRDECVFIHENGGESLSLWDWLLKYGGCSDDAQVKAVLESFSNQNYVEYKEPEKVEARYVDNEYAARLSKRYFGTLFNFLLSYVDGKRLREVWRMYEVGVIYDTAIFWYRNAENLLCHDVRIDYTTDGHRDKNKPPRRLFTGKNGYTNECLFGDHIHDVGKKVIVVESEKTAIIGACFYPKFKWVATGGGDKVYLCKDKGYIMAPDFEQPYIEKWSQYGQVWEWWKGSEVNEKEDVGDLILRNEKTSKNL